jgi:hypothetical protein
MRLLMRLLMRLRLRMRLRVRLLSLMLLSLLLLSAPLGPISFLSPPVVDPPVPIEVSSSSRVLSSTNVVFAKA